MIRLIGGVFPAAVATLLACGLITWSVAGESPDRSADEAAIRQVSQAFAKAFATGNAEAVGQFFTAQAEYVDESREPLRGREAIRQAYSDFFAERKQVDVESTTEAIRFLSAETAIEDGTFSVKTTGGATSASRFSTLFVREDGQWKIALLKEWSAPEVSAPKMADLAWLAGTWESGDNGSTARSVYQWNEGDAFIRVAYSVTLASEGDEPVKTSGTQMIGIDPATGAIRSWTFSSEGGIGEADWMFDGGRWVIQSAGHTADGELMTATNLLTPRGQDEFTWQSVERTLGGEPQPDLEPVVVRRVPNAR